MQLPNRLTLATYGFFLIWFCLSLEQHFAPEHWTDKADANPTYRQIQWAAVRSRQLSRDPDEASDFARLLSAWILSAILPGVVAWRGGRTKGRSFIYQVGLSSFGTHGVKILLRSLVFRAYTPGLLVAPMVMLPFSIWSWMVLLEEGVTDRSGLIDAVLWAFAIDSTVILVLKSGFLVYRRGGRFIRSFLGWP